MATIMIIVITMHLHNSPTLSIYLYYLSLMRLAFLSVLWLDDNNGPSGVCGHGNSVDDTPPPAAGTLARRCCWTAMTPARCQMDTE